MPITRKVLRTALACSLLLALAHPAWADIERPVLSPSAFSAPKVGARLVYEDLANGRKSRAVFGRTQGMRTEFRWDGKPAVSLTPFCADCAQGIAADGGPLASLYPLQVGKGIKFTRRKGQLVWDDDILVTATERLTVPAGTFDTFIVRRRSQLRDGEWWAVQRNWYAPSLGWSVKFEGKSSDGRIQSWQLIEWWE